MLCKIARMGGWCGQCYASKRGREQGCVGERPRPAVALSPHEELLMKFIQKSNDLPSGKSGLAAADSQLNDRCPATHEWLAEQEWEPGKPRRTGTMMVFAEQGRWKACLHDRDQKRTCFVSAMTLTALLEAVEDVLANGGGDWRRDK